MLTEFRKDIGDNWDLILALTLALVAVHFGLKFFGRSNKGLAK